MKCGKFVIPSKRMIKKILVLIFRSGFPAFVRTPTWWSCSWQPWHYRLLSLGLDGRWGVSFIMFGTRVRSPSGRRMTSEGRICREGRCRNFRERKESRTPTRRWSSFSRLDREERKRFRLFNRDLFKKYIIFVWKNYAFIFNSNHREKK